MELTPDIAHAIGGIDAIVITKRNQLSSEAEWAICDFYGCELVFVPEFMAERGGVPIMVNP